MQIFLILISMWVFRCRVVRCNGGCTCCNADVVGIGPTTNRDLPVELEAVWDMPSGPSRHG